MAKLYFIEENGLVKLLLDSPNEKVNSVAGEITLSAGTEVRQVLEANSLINFWLDKPAVKENKIIFSGIIPGGYQGAGGQILSFSWQPLPNVRLSRVEATIDEEQVLLHDGVGTPAKLLVEPLVLSSVSAAAEELNDEIPPETFTPLISSDPALFDGQKFLVFQTQDKQSGIDYYEVKEGRGEWLRVESPYLLPDQTVAERILVKAVDLAGNERVVTAFSPSVSYLYYIGGGIIVLVLCLIAWKKLFSRS